MKAFNYLFPHYGMTSFLLTVLPFSVPAKTSPHIIIIYVDDMGYGDLSCYGGTLGSTPNIDRMAEEGIRFTQYYSAAPVSSPSRVALTTGMYPIRHGIHTFLNDREMNTACQQNDYLSADAPSMARELKKNGYKTAHIGKWHMGGGRDVNNAPSIAAYGFDQWYSTWESPDPDPLVTSTNWIWANSDSIKRWERTRYFVDRTIEFLQEHPDQPCFINLWLDDVHTPWVPDAEAAGKSQREWSTKDTFVPVLIETDHQIGRLMEALQELGIDKNTLVIFTSDNGPAPSFDNMRSGGLRGTKNSLYEGGIREPLIIRWPEKIQPGQINEKTVLCSVDMFPSICKIAGVKYPGKRLWDGTDMSRSLLGIRQDIRKTPLFWDFGRNERFNFPDTYNRSPHLAIRKKAWKLLCNADGSDIRLYNLDTDPTETNEISKAYPAITKELSAELIDWYTKNNTIRSISKKNN